MKSENFDLVENVLKELHTSGALGDMILIGSWCLYFYELYFDDTRYNPVIKTLDIDFLIPRPNQIKNRIDLHETLKHLQFEEIIGSTGVTKFISPKFNLEFLVPKTGKGEDEKLFVERFNINAVQLRYLNFLSGYTFTMKYKNIPLMLPEPAAYVLHKFIVSQRRLHEQKRIKDIQTAVSLGEYIITVEGQQKKLRMIINDIPKSWKKDILNITSNYSEDLHAFLLGC